MKDDFPRYTLRISQILLDKIGYIAEYEGRTKNKEIEHFYWRAGTGTACPALSIRKATPKLGKH